MPKAKYIAEVKAKKSGYIESLDAEKCGKVSLDLGAGRIRKEDKIDHTAGIVLEKKIGDKVKTGEVLCYIYTNVEEKIEKAKLDLEEAYTINEDKPKQYKHILGII